MCSDWRKRKRRKKGGRKKEARIMHFISQEGKEGRRAASAIRIERPTLFCEPSRVGCPRWHVGGVVVVS
jgi:hypothetical protein